MAAVTKTSDGNDAMTDIPEDKPSRKIPPSYPPSGPKGPPAYPPGGHVPTTSGGHGYFSIYKRGQGYWTRLGTVGAVALIGVLAGAFIYDQLNGQMISSNICLAASGIFCAVYAAFAFHYMNKPLMVDFLIATDSEMKKVNWTSRRELIGSTRVVIFFMFAIALILFVYDLLFHTIFYLLHVLKTPPPFFPDKR